MLHVTCSSVCIILTTVCYRSHVLVHVCRYLSYKVKHTNTLCEIPEFEIDPKVALELLMAANFLDC